MLTRKQHELLLFIHERLQETGVPPSFDEMKDALDLRSKSGIHRLITALEERGFIRRLPNRARALEILKLPESFGARQVGQPAPQAQAAGSAPVGRTGFRPSVIEGSRGQSEAHRAAASAPKPVAAESPTMIPDDGPDRCRRPDLGHSAQHALHRPAAGHARRR